MFQIFTNPIIRQVLMLAAIVVLSFLFLKQCNKTKQQENQKEKLAEGLALYQKRASIFQNLYGKQVTTTGNVRLTLQSFKIVMGDSIENITKKFNIKIRNLQQYTQMQVEINQSLRTKLLHATDTVYLSDNGDSTFITRRLLNYTDSFLTLKGTLYNCDDLKIDTLRVRVPLELAVIYMRKHSKLFGKRRKWMPRWGPKEYETRAVSENPSVTIPDIKSFTIEKSNEF